MPYNSYTAAPGTKRARAKQAASKISDRDATQLADDGQPRYVQIARELTRAIADGRYAIGAHLPTEAQLCERFGTSRLTARAALQVLTNTRLITRRKRAGTIVTAAPGDASYSQAVSSVKDLLQYARDTELRLLYIGKVALSVDQAGEYGAEPGAKWVFAFGLRYEPPGRLGTKPGRPICVTRLFLNPILEGIEDRLREPKTAVYELIERDFNVTFNRVDQSLHAVVLGGDDAANLDALAGSPALRIVRQYFDDQGRLLEVSDSLHTADRCVYHMQLTR
jgi:GntR family transcriptional regulator